METERPTLQLQMNADETGALNRLLPENDVDYVRHNGQMV